MMIRRIAYAVCFLTVFVVSHSRAAEQGIRVVVSKDAPALEQFAAQECAVQLRKLTGQAVAVANSSGDASTVILLGSPKTSPQVAKSIGTNWPKLSDQGFVLKDVSTTARSQLVVGGNTPRATLWAVYELGHHFGIRYLLKQDIYPQTPTKLDIKVDRVVEPVLRTRSYRLINDFAMGSESWPLKDQKQLLRQLAKMKFNRVMLSVYPWQPFVQYKFAGVEKETALLWYGERFAIPRDAPGRNALVGLKVFENPDFAGKATPTQMHAAGKEYFGGIVSEAKRLGMTVGVSISPLEFPKEFAKALPGLGKARGLNGLVVAPGSQVGLYDKRLSGLVSAKIRAYLKAYPGLDTLYLTLPEFPEWDAHVDQAWKDTQQVLKGESVTLEQLTSAAAGRKLIANKERGVRALRGNLVSLAFFRKLFEDESLLRRADGSRVQLMITQVDPALHPYLDQLLPKGAGTLAFVDYTARRVAENKQYLASVPAKKVTSQLILTLADDNVGVLSQSATRRLEQLVKEISRHGWDGFSTRHWMLAELDPTMYFLSRAAWSRELTARSAHDDLFIAITGKKAAADRLWLGFGHIEQATELIDKEQIGFGFPVPGMLMKHYKPHPAPAWWKSVNESYTQGMIELYRSNDASDPRAQKLIFYWAKRGEYVLEYLAAVTAVREAALAKKSGDKDKAIEHLESAIENLYNAIDTLSDVARDQSDRGLIATLIRFAYVPLMDEYEKLAE